MQLIDGDRALFGDQVKDRHLSLCQLSYSPVERGWEVDPIASQAQG
jgi:hypothetical protein